MGQGDTLWALAARYYAALDRPSGLWWAIADFQPEPVFDPTLALVLGRVMIVPSVRTVLSRILSETRRGLELV